MEWKQRDGSREDSRLPASCALWPVEIKLIHTDCSPENTLVHFQGQYATICELDYNILQVEIQNTPKTTAFVEVGDMCLVEDLLTNHWYRGRVQNKSGNMFDVFLLDHGNILTVASKQLSTISNSLLMLPPKVVCGFIANMLPVQECWNQPSEAYFFSLIDKNIEGYIHGYLPYKVLILEVPKISKDLLRLNLGRHVDTDTFLLLVELEMDVSIQQSCESVPDLLIEMQVAQEISFKASNLCGYEDILPLGCSKLTVGQKERVKIASGINPGLFYCQLSITATDLKEMSEQLADACESKICNFTDYPSENMGLLCAIKGKDEKWHRGLVQSLPVNSQVRVVFIDYGYCESVKVENIFQLPSEFILRPVMTFPCSLSCLHEKDKATVSQQLLLLRKGLTGKEVMITVDDLTKGNGVCSVTLSTAECAPVERVQSQQISKMSNSGLVGQLSYISNETKIDGISKNLIALGCLRDGYIFEGCVEHVVSPHDFWMRTAYSNDRFETMMNKLIKRFNGLQLKEEILQDPVPGQLCCAMYDKDMHYYRARVVNILEYGAEVFFIDFGNTEKVPSMLIKTIPTEFTVEPEFAFNCSLAHVVPVDDVWTAASTNLFRKVTSNKALLAHIICRKSDVFVVELNDKVGEKSIARLLIGANMAEYWAHSVVTTSSTPVADDNKTNNTFIKGKTGEKSSKRKSTWKNPANVPRQVISTINEVHTKTINSNALEVFKCQKFNPGAVIRVQCSHVSSPDKFWCQNKKYTNNLDTLMERLQDFYQKNTSVLWPQSACCAVCFPLDHKWYRGCILEKEGVNVRVGLVDYGMIVEETMENIRVLHPEFLELEVQALRCSLYNFIVPIKGDVWSDKARISLLDFTSRNSRDLHCIIYSQVFVSNEGLCNMVGLYTPLHRASAHLIETGVAEKNQHPHQLLPCAVPCSFVYSSFDITIGSEELVFPTHIVSPWEIYLQLDRNSSIIEHLKERAMKESKELTSLACTNTTSSFCLAKYSEDGQWYRSFVWPAHSILHLNVFFVDYGSKQVAEKKNVVFLPQRAVDLLLIPMQALRCSLSSIPETEEHMPDVNTWLEKTIINKGLKAIFVATNNCGNFLCDLFDGDIHINEKVREMFAAHAQKVESVRKPIPVCYKKLGNVSSAGSKIKTKGGHCKETVVKSRRTPGCCKFIQRNGSSFQEKPSKLKSYSLKGRKKNQNFKPKRQFEKERGSSIPDTPDVQPFQMSDVRDLPGIKITPGFRSTGFISHRDSVDSFFIQLEQDEQAILKIREELNSSSFTESLRSVPSNVKVGDLVAARYDEDLALYRAAVRNVASSGKLTVEFVDYGNTETVDRKKVYSLASRFLHDARLSTYCKLTKPYNPEDAESFLAGTHDCPMIVEFVKNLGDVWEVSIHGLDPLHDSKESDPAERKEGKDPDSGQAKLKEELCPAVQDDASLPRTCKKTEAETTNIKEDTEILECGTKVSRIVQEKSWEDVQATKAVGCPPTFRTNRNASELPQRTDIHNLDQESESLNGSNHSCGLSCPSTHETTIEQPDDGVYGQDSGTNKCQAVVPQSTSEYDPSSPIPILPKKPDEKDDEIRHLFLAPVTNDHEYSGYAAAVSTPEEFYIVLEDLLLFMSSVSSVLENLLEDFALLPEAQLIPGTGCLVKFEDDRKLCRAEIIQCDDISVIIHLVDYGYCAHLARQDIWKLKKLPVELAGLPRITYPCLLRGIKPADGLQWSDQATLFLQQCMYQKNLKIYFRNCVSEVQWEVDVVASNRNVAKDLVEAGYARYVDTLLGLRFQQGQGHPQEVKFKSVGDSFRTVYGKHEEIQSQMDKEPDRHLEDMSAHDGGELSEGCSMDGEASAVEALMDVDQGISHFMICSLL